MDGSVIFFTKVLGMTVVHEEGDDFATWISVSPLVHELALMGDESWGHTVLKTRLLRLKMPMD